MDLADSKPPSLVLEEMKQAHDFGMEPDTRSDKVVYPEVVAPAIAPDEPKSDDSRSDVTVRRKSAGESISVGAQHVVYAIHEGFFCPWKILVTFDPVWPSQDEKGSAGVGW